MKDCMVVLALVLGIAAFSVANSQDDAFELTVVHTNDIHCHLSKHNWDMDRCPPGYNGACFGGMDAIKGFYNYVKSQEKNVIHLNAGDNVNIHNSNWCSYYMVNASAHFGNLMEWDAVVFGNHEFDIDEKYAAEYAKKSNFTIVASNMASADASGLNGSYKPYTILERGGRKIAVIGYLHNVTCFYENMNQPGWLVPPKMTSFSCESSSIFKIVDQLLRQGVNIIIALGHSGLPQYDLTLAELVPEIDLIVGGHSQSFLWNGKWATPPADADEYVDGPYPKVVTNKLTGKQVPIVHCYKWGKYACKIKLVFDKDGVATSWSGSPVLLKDDSPRDSFIQQELQKWEAQIPSWDETRIANITPWHPSETRQVLCSC